MEVIADDDAAAGRIGEGVAAPVVLDSQGLSQDAQSGYVGDDAEPVEEEEGLAGPSEGILEDRGKGPPAHKRAPDVVSSNVHIFYYAWYGSPAKDGKWLHWNHPYLPHWDSRVLSSPRLSGEGLGIGFAGDIGSTFYPRLGPYSSMDPHVMADHMAQMRAAGAGVVVLSWYPPGSADSEGHPNPETFPMILSAARGHGLQVCLHVEPYKDRGPATLLRDLKWLTERYGTHPGLYRRSGPRGVLPLVYLYDSYLTSSRDWATVFGPSGSARSVRGTPADAYVLGLLVEARHQDDILRAGFDGFYTYFASEAVSYGSHRRNWPALAQFARANSMLFAPSVGPGYDDLQVRPWNSAGTTARAQGQTYDSSWSAALAVKPPIVSITSFNEWHEGTQIEEAVEYVSGKRKYPAYETGPDMYLNLTRKWVSQMDSGIRPTDRS